MSNRCWLVKQEPEAYSFADLLREGKTEWTGVRNFQARNNLRSMRKGDLVFFYHSVSEKQVVGVAEVSRPAFHDPTAKEGDWVAVEIKPRQAFTFPIPLSVLKSDPALKAMALLRQSRLSVTPVTSKERDRLLELAQGQ